MTQLVVGYDGSRPSREAVLWAAGEARTRKCPLTIVGCYDIPIASGVPIAGWAGTEAVDALLQAAERSVAEAKTMVRGVDPELDVRTVVSPGPAELELTSRSKAGDLVVVGASGHRGLAATLLGSTPRYVIRHSPCPVVVVRGAASRGGPDRIVGGVDGSPSSDAAVAWAAEEADRQQVGLTLVHCWSFPYPVDDANAATAHDLTRTAAEAVLEVAAGRARDLCLADVERVLVEASAPFGLLTSVRDGDLLVLGSHGRGAVASHLVGSTVNAVLESCAVPVAVIRPSGGGSSDPHPR